MPATKIYYYENNSHSMLAYIYRGSIKMLWLRQYGELYWSGIK